MNTLLAADALSISCNKFFNVPLNYRATYPTRVIVNRLCEHLNTDPSIHPSRRLQ